MANTKAFKIKNGLDLGAYSKEIDDTAVDVFVYDTSQDSDGGAWRHRTQATSWYNETLNTATRGSRKEFPAVAVIVITSAEQTSIMIYDGDDPDLPLWMSFNRVTTNGDYTLAYSSGPTAISALDGIISFGSNLGVGTINFVADNSYRRRSSGGDVAGYYLSGIADRNAGSGFESNDDSSIVNNTINDLAMTVLPNAPIDAATGLPVPTIAVATNGGVSVIRDDGTVVDSSSTGTGHTTIGFTKDHKLIYQNSVSNGNRKTFVLDNVPTADGFTGDRIYGDGGTVSADLQILSNSYVRSPVHSDGGFASAGYSEYPNADNRGFVIVDENIADASSGMVVKIDGDYNTGWMNGDIKLATLSDTDDTDVTGSELVTNGTFDSDTTGWTSSGSEYVLSVDSNTLKMTKSGSASVFWAYQVVTTEVGKTYTVTASIKRGTGSNCFFRVGTAVGSGGYLDSSTTSTSFVKRTVTFTASNTSTYLSVGGHDGADGTTAFADNISVRLAEEDRSVNGNGLQVFGTVDKDPVATGADLVAYSGWANGNYLQQPYNADLNFGTGDLSFMVWVYPTSSTTGKYVFQRGNAAGTGTLIHFLAVHSTGPVFNVGGTHFTQNGTNAPINQWSMYCGVRRNGKLELYYNGTKEDVGTASGSAVNINATDHFLNIGNRTDSGGASFPGSIALLRISGTAPSPEQIKKIYEDEKVLFQENAQATLYGSSDAVTALAYDDTTELLHVGTSAGRSVFQGLRRVDNTTTAVGAAISASNGLVADE